LIEENIITATDALFGFGAWLTTREEAVTFSRNDDATKMVNLITKFLETNNLPDVSEHYPDNFIMPQD